MFQLPPIENINTNTMYRFLTCLRGIGKTTDMIESVKNFIDDKLIFKKEFEVCVICANRNELKLLQYRFTDFYNKYIDLKTTYDILYKLYQFPLDSENPENFPNIKQLYLEKNYEKYFIDPSCYELIILQQLDRFKQIGELL